MIAKKFMKQIPSLPFAASDEDLAHWEDKMSHVRQNFKAALEAEYPLTEPSQFAADIIWDKAFFNNQDYGLIEKEYKNTVDLLNAIHHEKQQMKPTVTLTGIDPEDCNCVKCQQGYHVPVNLATSTQVQQMLDGGLDCNVECVPTLELVPTGKNTFHLVASVKIGEHFAQAENPTVLLNTNLSTLFNSTFMDAQFKVKPLAHLI